MMIIRLRSLREDNDYTQQQLAEKLFINRRTYAAYENGTNCLPVDILIKLSEIYSVSTDYILGLTDNPEKVK